MKRLLLLLGTVLEAQAIQPDLQPLAGRIKALGRQEGILDLNPARKAFVAWADLRLGNRATVAALRQELRQAGLTGVGRSAFFGTNLSGLAKIETLPLPSAPDLFALRLGIGVASAYDQTIVLYQRRPWSRLATLHYEFSEGYSQFSSFIIGATDNGGSRVIVSAGYPILHRYSDEFPVKLRIEMLAGGSLKTLLDREESVGLDTEQERFEDEVMSASLDGNIVTFRYWRRLRDESFSPSILRYSVSAGGVNRIAPVAVTRSAFLDEWIRMDDREAAQWSTPEAVEGHRAISAFLRQHKGDNHISFEKISLCAGSPRSWQVVARSAFNAPTETWVFLFSESGASNLRMLSAGKEEREDCVAQNEEFLTKALPDS